MLQFDSPAVGIRRSRDDLSGPELEVLGLVADGLTDEEIAAHLYKSRHTIHRHCSNIYEKTGLRRRIHLARYAVAHGYVPVEWDVPENGLSRP